MTKLKIKPIFKDILHIYIAEILVLFSVFIVYRLVAVNFGPDGVGEFSLIKRISGFLIPLLLLGFGTGIPRYLNLAENEAERSAYFKSSILAVFFAMSLILFAMEVNKKLSAEILFGNADFYNMIDPLMWLTSGLIFHTLVYSYFRGKLRIHMLNWFLIINIVIVPIAILIYYKNLPLESIIFKIGILNIVISVLFALFFVKELYANVDRIIFKKCFKRIFSYSLPRTIGEFIFAGFLSVGPIIAVHVSSMKDAGFLSISQSLLSAIAAGITPIGVIMLPKVSDMIKSKREEDVREILHVFFEAIVYVSVFLSFQLIIFSDSIIKYWLGNEFMDAVAVTQITLLSVVFYAFYIANRNILDAASAVPYNTINMVISLLIYISTSFAILFIATNLPAMIGLSISFVIASFFLGILTYVSIRRIFCLPDRVLMYNILVAIFINVMLGGAVIYLKEAFVANIYALLLLEVFIAFTYVSILWVLKISWLRRIFEMLKIRETSAN